MSFAGGKNFNSFKNSFKVNSITKICNNLTLCSSSHFRFGKAFDQMEEKQKESAMSFFEKHQKDFPLYCDQGFVSIVTRCLVESKRNEWLNFESLLDFELLIRFFLCSNA